MHSSKLDQPTTSSVIIPFPGHTKTGSSTRCVNQENFLNTSNILQIMVEQLIEIEEISPALLSRLEIFIRGAYNGAQEIAEQRK